MATDGMLIVQVYKTQVKIRKPVSSVYTFHDKFYHWDFYHPTKATL